MNIRDENMMKRRHLFYLWLWKSFKGCCHQIKQKSMKILCQEFCFLVVQYQFKFMYSDVIFITSWSDEEIVYQFESSQIKCINKFVLQKIVHTRWCVLNLNKIYCKKYGWIFLLILFMFHCIWISLRGLYFLVQH